ncbi:hypothetical protein KAFR_0D00530 [Kazachstania africana CBS 2517]|uniref:PSP1 C-terminal domain-containing protein n=1 Tax=Kazachstania africana (strain ATCC 22294 / BCRC 22015 / CBS 2517 / CECT 1963 / NBRC 1671 / NRRL Y-8276) TaxID=1071382 RepID=H2ATK0_KAZAF|nr:hypothetical protein KAFR_0D00530 [Kazachstania africana CBS 2517]CCF57700.1 hypothetical protein KAFR_0D00530 [Kazachstania africana CBS 2517]
MTLDSSLELPSINSTTSISDNPELKNYYDKLLFKNSSGKSLTDLPRKAREAAAAANNSNNNNNPNTNITAKKIDFIKGFTDLSSFSPNSNIIKPSPLSHNNPNTFSNPELTTPKNNNNNINSYLFSTFHIDGNNNNNNDYSTTTTTTRRHSIFTGKNDDIFASNNLDSLSFNNFNENSSTNESTDILSPLTSAGHLYDNNYSTQRRSSYISDTLIHNHNNSNNNYYNNNNNNNNPSLQNTTQVYQQQNQPVITSNTFNNNYSNYLSQQRRNTMGSNVFKGNNNQQQQQYNYYNYLQNSNPPSHYIKNTNNGTTATTAIIENTNGNNNQDNGLILVGDKQLTSSKDLQKLYQNCGTNYFSSELVFEFTDYIKSMLTVTNSTAEEEQEETSQTKERMLRFLSFLKSCNLNYNPQSDAFISRSKKEQIMSPSSTTNKSKNTSTYLHYKPLLLVALKNGKLELLSIPQNSNLIMKRGDLVVIDGDRGKDLSLVVEPQVDLSLALIINFLKKKIHFDSLITSKNQHYSNKNFVNALIDSTQGINDDLNPRLYDVIELTQLVIPSKQVLRFATPFEVSTNLHNKFQDELKALHIAQLKLKSLNSGLSINSNNNSNSSNNNKLNIKILNSEFQFDRKKLTFYYICEERNDFRELIKELFKFYKTRIWLCAIPNNLEIDSKYYDNEQKEFKMYKDMMSHYNFDDLNDLNFQHSGAMGGFIVAPSLNELQLDNFQIGVYKELVIRLFG